MNSEKPPDFARLLDYLEGRLPPDEARAVAERLQTADAATLADLEWLRAFLHASRTVVLAAPPPGVREVLRRRFTHRADLRKPPGFFRRGVAALIFDSRVQPATPGLRSATTEGLDRQLVYASEMAEITLNIHPRAPGQGYSLSGQVFPSADTPANAFIVQVLRGEAEVAQTTTDHLGEFAFEPLPEGEYEVVVSTGDRAVIVPAVRLQP